MVKPAQIFQNLKTLKSETLLILSILYQGHSDCITHPPECRKWKRTLSGSEAREHLDLCTVLRRASTGTQTLEIPTWKNGELASFLSQVSTWQKHKHVFTKTRERSQKSHLVWLQIENCCNPHPQQNRSHHGHIAVSNRYTAMAMSYNHLQQCGRLL